MHDFHGVLAPVPTPFTDDGGAISEVRLARWLRRMGESGVHGFVVGGDAGEFGALTFAERKQIFDLLLRSAPAGAAVAAHVSTLSTSAAIDLALHAAGCGAKAAVMMPPYYGRFTDAELAAHFHAVAHHGRLPLFVVDPMARIGFELHETLSQIPEIRIATPMARGAHESEACFDRTTVDEFVVGEALASPLASLGRIGLPDRMAVQRLFRDYGAARVIKAACELGGLELGPLRNPMRGLPAAASELLKAALQEAA